MLIPSYALFIFQIRRPLWRKDEVHFCVTEDMIASFVTLNMTYIKVNFKSMYSITESR